EMVASTLTVTAQADGTQETVVFTSAAQPPRQRTEIDLGPWSDRIIRLVFRADPEGAAPDAGCLVHGLTVTPPSATATVPPFRRASARPPNVVVYVIDTLRADHLGCYGYRRPTTPQIDGFRASAVL